MLISSLWALFPLFTSSIDARIYVKDRKGADRKVLLPDNPPLSMEELNRLLGKHGYTPKDLNLNKANLDEISLLPYAFFSYEIVIQQILQLIRDNLKIRRVFEKMNGKYAKVNMLPETAKRINLILAERISKLDGEEKGFAELVKYLPRSAYSYLDPLSALRVNTFEAKRRDLAHLFMLRGRDIEAAMDLIVEQMKNEAIKNMKKNRKQKKLYRRSAPVSSKEEEDEDMDEEEVDNVAPKVKIDEDDKVIESGKGEEKEEVPEAIESSNVTVVKESIEVSVDESEIHSKKDVLEEKEEEDKQEDLHVSDSPVPDNQPSNDNSEIISNVEVLETIVKMEEEEPSPEEEKEINSLKNSEETKVEELVNSLDSSVPSDINENIIITESKDDHLNAIVEDLKQRLDLVAEDIHQVLQSSANDAEKKESNSDNPPLSPIIVEADELKNDKPEDIQMNIVEPAEVLSQNPAIIQGNESDKLEVEENNLSANESSDESMSKVKEEIQELDVPVKNPENDNVESSEELIPSLEELDQDNVDDHTESHLKDESNEEGMPSLEQFENHNQDEIDNLHFLVGNAVNNNESNNELIPPLEPLNIQNEHSEFLDLDASMEANKNQSNEESVPDLEPLTSDSDEDVEDSDLPLVNAANNNNNESNEESVPDLEPLTSDSDEDIEDSDLPSANNNKNESNELSLNEDGHEEVNGSDLPAENEIIIEESTPLLIPVDSPNQDEIQNLNIPTEHPENNNEKSSEEPLPSLEHQSQLNELGDLNVLVEDGKNNETIGESVPLSHGNEVVHEMLVESALNNNNESSEESLHSFVQLSSDSKEEYEDIDLSMDNNEEMNKNESSEELMPLLEPLDSHNQGNEDSSLPVDNVEENNKNESIIENLESPLLPLENHSQGSEIQDLDLPAENPENNNDKVESVQEPISLVESSNKDQPEEHIKNESIDSSMSPVIHEVNNNNQFINEDLQPSLQPVDNHKQEAVEEDINQSQVIVPVENNINLKESSESLPQVAENVENAGNSIDDNEIISEESIPSLIPLHSSQDVEDLNVPGDNEENNNNNELLIAEDLEPWFEALRIENQNQITESNETDQKDELNEPEQVQQVNNQVPEQVENIVPPVEQSSSSSSEWSSSYSQDSEEEAPQINIVEVNVINEIRINQVQNIENINEVNASPVQNEVLSSESSENHNEEVKEEEKENSNEQVDNNDSSDIFNLDNEVPVLYESEEEESSEDEDYYHGVASITSYFSSGRFCAACAEHIRTIKESVNQVLSRLAHINGPDCYFAYLGQLSSLITELPILAPILGPRLKLFSKNLGHLTNVHVSNALKSLEKSKRGVLKIKVPISDAPIEYDKEEEVDSRHGNHRNNHHSARRFGGGSRSGPTTRQHLNRESHSRRKSRF